MSFSLTIDQKCYVVGITKKSFFSILDGFSGHDEKLPKTREKPVKFEKNDTKNDNKIKMVKFHSETFKQRNGLSIFLNSKYPSPLSCPYGAKNTR